MKLFYNLLNYMNDVKLIKLVIEEAKNLVFVSDFCFLKM